MTLLQETIRADAGLSPRSLATTNATGDWLPLTAYRGALAMLQVGAAATAVTAQLEILEAKDAAGTGAQAIAGATRTVTVPTKMQRATLTLATVLDGDSVTINGLTFTGKAAPTAGTREFSQAGTDTADAAALAALVNDSTLGVPGVLAIAAAAVVSLVGTGETAITITAPAATITPACVAAAAIVELDHFDLSAGYTHIAIKVTTVGTALVGVALLRGDPRDLVKHPGEVIAV